MQDYTFAASNKDIIYPTEIVPSEDAPATGIAAKPVTDKKNNAVAANTKPVNNANAKTAVNNKTVKPAVTKPEVVVTTIAAPEKMQTVQEVAKTEDKIAQQEPQRNGNDIGKIVRVNGLRAVYGYRGDVLLTYAIKHNIRYERLLEINELPDAPIMSNMYIFLDKKKTRGEKATHTVGTNETLNQIAQAEGMQQKSLRLLNNLEDDEEPLPGEILSLQRQVTSKPQVVVKNTTLPVATTGKPGQKTAKKSTYLDKKELEKSKKQDKPVVAVVPKEAPVKTLPSVIEEPVKPVVKPVEPPVVAVAQEEAPKKLVLKTRAERMREAREAEDAKRFAGVATKTPIETPVKEPEVIEAQEPVKPSRPVKKEEPVAIKEEPKEAPVVKEEAPVKEAEIITEPVKEEVVAVKEEPVVIKEEPIKKEEEPVKEVVIEEPKAAPPVIEEPRKPVVSNVPQDEFSRLKAQLDKVVYASDNKEAEAKAEAARQQEKKVVAQSAAQKELTANVKADANYYVVQKGDTAFSIAKKNKVTMRQLMEWNNMDWAEVQVGQSLKVKQ